MYPVLLWKADFNVPVCFLSVIHCSCLRIEVKTGELRIWSQHSHSSFSSPRSLFTFRQGWSQSCFSLFFWLAATSPLLLKSHPFAPWAGEAAYTHNRTSPAEKQRQVWWPGSRADSKPKTFYSSCFFFFYNWTWKQSKHNARWGISEDVFPFYLLLKFSDYFSNMSMKIKKAGLFINWQRSFSMLAPFKKGKVTFHFPRN